MASDDEFVHLITKKLCSKFQKSTGRKVSLSDQKKKYVFESESDSENPLDPSVEVKEESDGTNVETDMRKSVAKDASTAGVENDSPEEDASYDDDEESGIDKQSSVEVKDEFESGSDEDMYGEQQISTENESASDREEIKEEYDSGGEEVQDADPKPTKRSKRNSAHGEESLEAKGETTTGGKHLSKMSKKEQPSSSGINTKSKQLGGQIRKRRRLMALRNLGEEQISQAKSGREKDLMSLVFGGKTEIVAKLTKEPKKAQPARMKGSPLSTGGVDKKKRAAIWHDSDDDDEEDGANLKLNKYNRDQGRLTYERRRKQFEQLVGKPKWAELDRVREPSDSDDEIMRTVGHVVKGKSSTDLPKGMIELKKLKNLNRETKLEGKITSINFHPTSMVAVISGKTGMVSIVAVDGARNEKLHTIGLEKFRLVCTRLSPDGNEAIFGSYRKFYHVFNLLSGETDTLKIPERETWSMRNFRISSCGKYLATVGDCGEVHVLSAKGKELLWTIQLRYVCQALAFTPDSRYLLCHSNDVEVSVYCIDKRRIVNVFLDEGCVNGSTIAVCPNGQFVATGSRQGIVNIYPLHAILEQKHPVPLKTIDNLTTYIDSLTFNATSELLAFASSSIVNAVKLIHVKSGTVFRNFPVQMASLGHVTTVEFSPSGGYLALGNKKSVVSLFRVKHYQNY